MGETAANAQLGYNQATANEQAGVYSPITAQQQQQYNVGTQAGSQYNQSNPYGNINYQQTGTGPNGVPIYSANVGYSAPQQGLYNTQVGGQQTAGTGAATLLSGANYGSVTPQAAIGNMVSGITGQNLAAETASLEPYFGIQNEQEQAQLAAQGITPMGNPTAYNNAMSPFLQAQNSTVANFLASQEPTIQGQAMSEYQLPEQMATALGTYGAPTSPTGIASQVAQPSLAGTTVTPTTVQPVNLAGDISAITAPQIAQAQQQQSMYNALMGGLSSLGSAGILGYSLSDVRLKRDITEIGRLDNDIGLYRFRYIWDDQPYIGVMAQEVEGIVPEAVVYDASGYLRVNYARLGLQLVALN